MEEEERRLSRRRKRKTSGFWPRLNFQTLVSEYHPRATACGEKAHGLQPWDESRWGLNGITSYYLMGGMKKTAFRFRLYPNHKQERRLLRMIETSRRLWNDALFHRKGAGRRSGSPPPTASSAGFSPPRGGGTRCWGNSTRRQDRRFSDASTGPSRGSSSNGRDIQGSRSSPHPARSSIPRRTTVQ